MTVEIKEKNYIDKVELRGYIFNDEVDDNNAKEAISKDLREALEKEGFTYEGFEIGAEEDTEEDYYYEIFVTYSREVVSELGNG